MNKFIEKSIKKYFQLRQFRIELWMRYQHSTQDLLLQELLNTAANTAFGKEHQFDSIFSLEDFQKKVPVRSYEETYPYIQRMLQGEGDVLWTGKIKFFSKSSGTTNARSKYLPVTREALSGNHYKAGRDVYTFFLMNHPESNLLEDNGSVISITGSLQEQENGIKVGDVSAILASQLPIWAQKRRQPSIEVALMEEWKEKIPALIEDTLDKNITHILGVPTWFVNIFEELKKQHDYTSLRDIWPNLELFIHGAVAFEPYRSIFENIIPHDDMKYIEVYNASEGFFAIQDDMSKNGELALLTDHGVFYEFIPLDAYHAGSREAIGLKDVKLDIDYAMIITTNSGLWRYDIGDTIMFTSLEPYRIKITGRTKHFINICGEELMVGNTDQALATVCEKTQASIEQYTVAPIFMNKQGKAGHQWLIEFKQAPPDVSEFARLLDQELQEVNSDYKAKRQDDIAFQPLELHVAKEGVFMKWLEQKGKLGGQHKVPRLSNKRDVLEEILEIVHN